MFRSKKEKFVRRDDLIIDFGMHFGIDTRFYLEKGFNVVAVEANVQLAKAVANELKNYISAGKLIIENVGIGPKPGKFTFYRHLENAEWSTFEPRLAALRPPFEEIQVNCVTPTEIFAKHGVPYYAKIDIEGLDMCVVEAAAQIEVKPKYLSVENGPPQIMFGLWNAGWRRFKFLNMKERHLFHLPNPAREGNYVPWTFGPASSGPFGEEVPGEWLPFDKAMHFYMNEVRNPYDPRPERWFDIHCAV